MQFIKKNIGIILVVLLSFFSFLPFLHGGFFPVHDDTQVVRVFEMKKALVDGMVPVRWVSDLGYGYGYPIFNFYSPLPYYIGGFLSIIGLNSLLATKIIFIFALLFSGISMYYFIKEFFGKFPAIVSSAIYLYFPYHAVNTYVRGDLDELYAYVFLPLVFLGLYKIFYIQEKNYFNKSLSWIFLTGVSVSLVIISHNLSAFMLFLTLIVFTILSLIFSSNKINTLLSYILILLIGFSLATFYWLPAVFEMRFTNVFSQVGGGANFQDHFVCIPQFWNSYWGFGGSTKGCLDGMSFKLGKFNIFLLFMSFVIFIYTLMIKKERNYVFLYLSSFVLFLLSIFLMLNYSTFIWKTVPFMEFLQYPWRFLNFAGLFLSILIGYMVYVIQKLIKQKKYKFLLVFIIIVLTLIFNTKLFAPKEFNNHSFSFYENRYYINWFTSKISDEYLPGNFEKPSKNSEIPQKIVEIKTGKGEYKILSDKTGYKKIDVNIISDSSVKLNIAYFPAWRTYINNQEVGYYMIKNGLSLNLNKGHYTLEVKFVQTKVEKLANIISLLSVFALFLGIIRHKYFKNYGKTS